MSLARDVIRLMRAAIAAAGRASEATTGVHDQASEIETEIRVHTDGSSAEKPAEAIVRLQQAKVRLEEAKIEFAAGSAAAEAYIAHLEGEGSNGGSPVAPCRSSNEPMPRATDQSFSARRYLDEMPYLPPRHERRRGGKPHKTHGRWVDADDGPQPDAISGEDSTYARQAQKLWDRVRDKTSDPKVLPIKGHYETKFAMFMRQQSKTDEHIVINNPDGPCGYGLENYRFGCDRLLPVLLPRDAKLTVDWPDGRATYTGARDS